MTIDWARWLVVAATTFCCYVSRSSAQVPALGPCPDIETVPNFDVGRYLGRWYEAERYFTVFEFGGKCVTANYTDVGEGVVSINNRQTSYLTGIQSQIEGEARVVSRNEDGKLSVKFPQLPVSFDAPYWVIGTDYKNFAVVWSCTNFGIFSTRFAWILTRERYPTLEVMERAYAVVDRSGISRAYFIRTDQRNCPASSY